MTDMRHDSIDDALVRAGSIDLGSLESSAALQARVDRKYAVSADAAVDLIGRLIAEQPVSALTIDEATSFVYRSNYFDTPDRLLMRLAAGARRRRFKVRTRVYESPLSCVLEVKLNEGRGVTTKVRAPYDVNDALRLTDAGQQFVSAATASLASLGNLRLDPSVATRYVRSTLVIGGQQASRVTVDRRVEWASLRDVSAMQWGLVLAAVIVESKSSGPPTAADRLLRAAGHRPQRISKFGFANALDDPRLPSNRWHRLLRSSP